MTSCTELEDNMPNPVERAAITRLVAEIESAWDGQGPRGM